MSNSVGVILVEKAEIGKIVLTPQAGIINHRINKGTITVHYSDDNFDYQEVPKDDYKLENDEEGRVTITFKETVSAVAFKVHSNHDDRDLYNKYVDLSTFKNDIDQIISVYQRADEGKIEYQYDAGGSRTERHTIVGNDDTTKYEYYEDSNRLKKASYSISGETYKEWYYIYDENGNLTAKGNEVAENADGSLSLLKDTPSSRYWEYEYSADNRLRWAYYKGEIKAEYSYDADGKRIVSDTEEGTTYFVFNYAGKAIFEEKLAESTTEQTSYIYALSKQIARVEGVIGGDGEVIYYHHDNLGSTMLMTNEDGAIIFDQDYLPFGGDLAVVGDIEPTNDVGEGYKYTGQRQETSIGLYYYGARFYDPEIGRFITEDTYVGVLANPQSQNIYIYTMNNPMKYIDLTGNMAMLPLPSQKILKTGEEIGRSIARGARYRAKHALDSSYDFANYMSIGMLGGIVSGAQYRTPKRMDSVYDFTNWLTLGTPDLFNITFNPDNPLSTEHWLASLRTATITTGLITASRSAILASKRSSVYKSTPDAQTRKILHNIKETRKGNEASNFKIHAAREARYRAGLRGNEVDFYARPNGDIIPSTGYRYMSRGASYIDDLKNTMRIPGSVDGTYFSFDKFSTPNPGMLQVPHDASMRGTFNTLQLIDDLRIPKGNWGKADWLEPITKDFIEYGSGGATQAITNKPIILDSLDDLLK